MNKEEILHYLTELNDLLRSENIKGEICLYGGAVLCVAYDARPSTKDVDAIFYPTQQIRQAVEHIAENHELRKDWLNDAVKGFVVHHPQQIFLNLSHLKVYIPEPDYLLAMKSLAARVDTTDAQDVKFLVGLLGIQKPDEVFVILEKYYPRQQIKPATQFFIEELFEQWSLSES